MVERRGTKALELWCRRITDGYPGVNVQNMTTSWRDGLAFCAMIHHFRPDLVDFNSLNKDDIYGNNELAFRIAEQQLGIPALLDAADMASCSVPDRLSILTYLSQFYQTFGGSSPSRLALKRTKEEPDARLASVSGSPQPKVAIRSGVRKEPCVVCGLPVFLAEKLVIERSLYHRTCFRCARCNHQLTIGNYYETEEGQYCCETCPDEEVQSPSVMHQEYNKNVLYDKNILFDDSVANEYTTNTVSGYQRALSDEEKTSKHRTLADVKDETPSRTSRMRLNFIASHLLSEKNPADDETSWNESEASNPQISPVVLTDDASSSSPSSSLAVSCETLPLESHAGAASDLNEEDSAVNSLDDKSINSFSASQHATAIASHDIDYEGRKFKEDTKDADRTGGSETQPLSLVQQRRKLFENNFQTDKKEYKAYEPNSVVVNISEAKPEVVERKPDDAGVRSIEVPTPSEQIRESQSLGVETSDVVEESFSAVDVEEESRGAVQELPSAVQVEGPPSVTQAKAPSGSSVKAEESKRAGQVEELHRADQVEDRHSGVEVEESPSADRVGEQALEVQVDEASEPSKDEEFPETTKREMPMTAVDGEMIVETLGDRSASSSRMEKSLTNVSGIDLSESNEDYPEDLNPFRSDEESDEDNKASRSKSKSAKAASTNPFGSSDEDEPPGMVPPRPAARKSKSPSHLVAQTTKRRLKAPDINLNPFWSDDEAVSDDDKIKKIEPKSLPIPKPRNIKPSPEPSPLPRKVSLERGGVNASNTSLASTGSTVTPGGTFRKKKPAPKPPAAEETAALDMSTIKSPEPAHRSYEQKDSPAQATPRVRKSKPAPPPPMFTSTPISAEECEPDKVRESSSLVWEEQKSNKDEANRTRQSLSAASGTEDSSHHYSSPFIDKSSQGKWKRKKGPAPPRPMPHRRKIKVMSTKDVKLELDEIEMQQQGLEKQGVRLEQLIRDKCETGEELEETNHRIDVEELVLELFALVNEKNELFRRQAELTLLRRQQRFEEEHADVEYQIRCLMSQPEATKTDSDKQREEMLIQRLVEIVERRNEIVECLEMDRRREVEEDRSIHKQMGLFAAKSKGDLRVDVDDNYKASPTSKKEKSKEKLKDRLSKKGCNKKDADKDVDESEMKLKRHKRKWF